MTMSSTEPTSKSVSSADRVTFLSCYLSSTLMVQPMDEAPILGSILLNKYRVDGVLGQGGMGSVVQVTDMQLGDVLALKTMLPGLALDPELRARFLREGQAAEYLRSEHIARVLDVGILANGAPYIAMEYLQGVDLAEELQRRMLRPGEAV